MDIGSSLTLTVTVPMPDAQPEMFWQLDAAFTRISEGAAGTVVGCATVKLYVQDGTTVERSELRHVRELMAIKGTDPPGLPAPGPGTPP